MKKKETNGKGLILRHRILIQGEDEDASHRENQDHLQHGETLQRKTKEKFENRHLQSLDERQTRIMKGQDRPNHVIVPMPHLSPITVPRKEETPQKKTTNLLLKNRQF